MTTPGFGGAQGFRNPETVVATTVIIEGPKGGLFVYSPSPGAGNLVLSIAAMAGTDKYGNAYPAGETIFDTTFQIENAGQTRTKLDQFGNYLVFNSFGALLYILAPNGGGWFIYEDTGSVTQGDLVATATSISGTDQFGNAFLGPGITTYGPAGSGQSIQIAPKVGASNNPFLRLLSGRASEGGGGFITEDVFNTGLVNEYLAIFFGSPGSNGPDESLALIQLASASKDASIIAGGLLQIQAATTVALAEWSAQGFVVNGGIGTAVLPGTGTSDSNLAQPEVWHTLGSPAATGFTSVHGRYRLDFDGNTLIDLQLNANAGGGTGGTYTYANKLPTAYQAIGTAARAYPMGYNAPLVAGQNQGMVLIDDLSSGANAGRVRIQIPNLAAGTTIGTTLTMPTT